MPILIRDFVPRLSLSLSLSLYPPTSPSPLIPSLRYGILNRWFRDIVREFLPFRFIYVALLFFFSPLAHQSSETRFLRRSIEHLRVRIEIAESNAIIRFRSFAICSLQGSGLAFLRKSSSSSSRAFSASSALKCVINCRHKSAYRSRTLRRVLNSPGFTRARGIKNFRTSRRRKGCESNRRAAPSGDTWYTSSFSRVNEIRNVCAFLMTRSDAWYI